jgi:hypothetical protein
LKLYTLQAGAGGKSQAFNPFRRARVLSGGFRRADKVRQFIFPARAPQNSPFSLPQNTCGKKVHSRRFSPGDGSKVGSKRRAVAVECFFTNERSKTKEKGRA